MKTLWSCGGMHQLHDKHHFKVFSIGHHCHWLRMATAKVVSLLEGAPIASENTRNSGQCQRLTMKTLDDNWGTMECCKEVCAEKH